MTDVTAIDDYPLDGRQPLFEEPYTVLVGLEAGESIPPHQHPDRVILFAVQEGVLDVTLDGDTTTVASGEVVRFNGEREVAVDAVEDARALVVLVES